MGQSAFLPSSRLLGCTLRSDPPSATLTGRDYPSATRVDFNHLDIGAAARFYCEYKTWERIHRGIADPRLLAIPASW